MASLLALMCVGGIAGNGGCDGRDDDDDCTGGNGVVTVW
jgi:hypothetical protein